MDPQKFTTIAHGGHRYYSPLSAAKAAALVALFRLEPGEHEYEGRYCGAIERYIEANPDDPDIDAMAKRIRPWHDAYLRWGRDTLGFGFYFLLKPAKVGSDTTFGRPALLRRESRESRV